MAEETTLRICRGDSTKSEMVDYTVPVAPGMVVLDAIHEVQARHAPDLAVRWNCKAGRCGSCGAEVNGKPRLMCMDRMDKYPAGEPIGIPGTARLIAPRCSSATASASIQPRSPAAWIMAYSPLT